MNGLRRYVQRRLALGLICGITAFLSTEKAFADGDEVSPAALVAARELFHEATEDVDAGRFAIALEKFKRVAAVKETAAVRFNIGRCEESLGKTGAALADFELAAREALDTKNDEIEKLSRERSTTLRPKVPRLTVKAPAGDAVSGMAVTLDGARLTPGTLGVGLPIDPGDHVVEANAPGHKPFRAHVALQAGESKQVQLALEAGGPEDAPVDGDGSSGRARQTWGWIAVGGGVALGAASVAFLLMERSAVSDLTDQCTPRCPASRADDLQSTRSRAVLDQGLAIGFGAGAVVAVGVGAYLLLTKSSPSANAPSAFIAPGAPGAPAGFSLHAKF